MRILNWSVLRLPFDFKYQTIDILTYDSIIAAVSHLIHYIFKHLKTIWIRKTRSKRCSELRFLLVSFTIDGFISTILSTISYFYSSYFFFCISHVIFWTVKCGLCFKLLCTTRKFEVKRKILKCKHFTAKVLVCIISMVTRVTQHFIFKSNLFRLIQMK